MGISLKTHKMLWGRAANRCAFPDCRLELVMDASETDDEALVGEECHIIAREPGGPRGDHSLPIESRDKYSNLILLCSTHQTLIDKQPQKYTVRYLQELKATHEKWVRESLQDFDPAKQRDEERYAAYIEEWVKLAHLNTWRDSLDWLFYGDQPEITKEEYDSLVQLCFWLSSRIWPKRYPELEAAFENFRRVLVDLLNTFDVHAFRREVLDYEVVKGEDITYMTNKFYKWHDDEDHDVWVERYLFYLDFLLDLGLELTRAANYICDKVRQFIDPTFRLREGVALVGSSREPIRTEYQIDEYTLHPYAGLKHFKEDRKHRDKKYYKGDPDDYYDVLNFIH